MSAALLQLINNAAIQTPQEAEIFLGQERQKPAASHPKFLAFYTAITQAYPDLSEEDEDGDNDENIWEEGLSATASHGNILTIAVKMDLITEPVLHSIVRAAAATGLHCYDEEGQILYRADGQAVDLRGHARAL